ncbi:hypothetical protein BJV78DRAFT_262384 [Lactifluus subvellereus]|nr:hypothetical protein BJV78DRAFT_262384 [Lactifluus subvellereus]
MGNRFSSRANTNSSLPPAPSRSKPPLQPEPEPESSQYGVPASTPPQNVRKKIDDRPPGPGPARVHAAPAPVHRTRSKSAHPSFRPGLPPYPSPPAVRPRAVTDFRVNRAGRSKFENPSSNVPQNSLQPVPPKSAQNDSGRRRFNSTVWSVLSDNFKFRILVVGKSRSGKSSLINSIFKVDTAPTPGNADINVGFSYPDNSRLIVHECPGFEPEYAQNLQAIREFITGRTDANLPLSETLHAIWICVPTTDLIDGRLGDRVEEILGTRKVPVVLVFTKFDLLVSQVLPDFASGDDDRAKARAQEMCEESCRWLLRRHPRNVPAEIVSTRSGFDDLISRLFTTTHRLVAADSLNTTVPSTSPESQRGTSQITPVALAWSIAQGVSRDVKLQASIVVGQSRYWRSLKSSHEFAGQTLEYCIDIIHTDIVDVWNLRDQNKYLSSREFKAQMSHLVKDLAVPHASASPRWCCKGWVTDVCGTMGEGFISKWYREHGLHNGLHCRPYRHPA